MNHSPLKTLARGTQYIGAGLAAWRAGHAGSEASQRKAHAHLAQRLGRLRGLPQKVGQLMSLGDFGAEANPYEHLREASDPVDFEILKPVIEEEWGRPIQEVCRQFDPAGLAASLGQVHRGFLKGGREVAIKVQYPGVAASLEQDLRALGWLSKPVGNLRAGFDLEEYQTVIRAGLEEELDYPQELKNQEEFRTASEGLAILVPEVFPKLSGGGVLTTAWEDGDTLETVVMEWTETERARLGATLVEQFLVMGLNKGLLHGDPHPGNYRFRRGPDGAQVVLYDFGCLCRLTDRERELLLCLIQESINPDSRVDPFGMFVALGFDAELLAPLRHKLPALCRILFEPFGATGKYDYNHWQLSERLEATLGSDRLNFRIAGPAKLLPFLRAFSGLVHVIKALGVPVFWSGPFRRNFDACGVTLDTLGLRGESESSATFAGIARHLRIRVTEGATEKVSLALPGSAVDGLHDLLDSDLKEKIRERGIDLDALIRTVRENLYAPQEVFSLEDGGKCVTVSLE